MFDFPLRAQLGFQNAASVIAAGIENLHHSIFFVLVLIFVPILFLIGLISYRFAYNWEHPTSIHMGLYRKNYLYWNGLTHGIVLEIIWTLTPTICLVLIAIPSFGLLYSIDEIIEPLVTYKVIGHQWYWSYELPTGEEINSYLKPFTDLQSGELRLLEVDQPLICPTHVHIRFLVTATDVLHSFAIPSVGIKIDAVPGRLNQVSMYLLRPGIYYGQCSELCGVNHGFMPIKLIATSNLSEPVNTGIYYSAAEVPAIFPYIPTLSADNEDDFPPINHYPTDPFEYRPDYEYDPDEENTEKRKQQVPNLDRIYEPQVSSGGHGDGGNGNGDDDDDDKPPFFPIPSKRPETVYNEGWGPIHIKDTDCLWSNTMYSYSTYCDIKDTLGEQLVNKLNFYAVARGIVNHKGTNIIYGLAEPTSDELQANEKLVRIESHLRKMKELFNEIDRPVVDYDNVLCLYKPNNLHGIAFAKLLDELPILEDEITPMIQALSNPGKVERITRVATAMPFHNISAIANQFLDLAIAIRIIEK